jgi:hypothetical protein
MSGETDWPVDALRQSIPAERGAAGQAALGLRGGLAYMLPMRDEMHG